jgi:uncharacterized protein (TIGR02147 family)
MVSIFIFDSYKSFLEKKIPTTDNLGRGFTTRLARFMKINPSFLSQVIKGDKHFSLEQALKVSEFLSLNALEKEYFIHLIQLERAGTVELRQYFSQKIELIKKESQKITRRISDQKELGANEQAIFYSNWYYSAIRLSCDIPELSNELALSEYLDIPLAKVNSIIEFLVQNGLCEKENEKLRIGVKKTHLAETSPYIFSHHRNWRLKAMENYSQFKEKDMAFSAPLTLSIQDFFQVKQILLEAIEKVSKTVSTSPSEELACLNIDFFSFDKN